MVVRQREIRAAYVGKGWARKDTTDQQNAALPREQHKYTKVANLDFEARVPVPFSIFPSTYRESESHTQTVTETKIHEEVEIKPQQPEAGREGEISSVSVTAEQVPPPRQEQEFIEEEVHITREEEHYHRPGVQKFEHEDFTIREDSRRYVRFYISFHLHLGRIFFVTFLVNYTGDTIFPRSEKALLALYA
ncbi:unnamed protein product [Fusarium venenatum]|uniref:Uncharacterized protein n=1 Tax=Fusarium venenatum TaxID=56646 RepID=A0A2L2SWA5_9HYPO|nr:uncharacterized protein FVRRES_05384 [Fusarium venenatum]CEI60948.1 unnamed protein product [Fusarium venenatum]